MHCAVCLDHVGMDWIEWRERHVINLGEQGHQLVTIHQAVLCAPPRVCGQEYAEHRNLAANAATIKAAGDEPF